MNQNVQCQSLGGMTIIVAASIQMAQLNKKAAMSHLNPTSVTATSSAIPESQP